jgi:ASC-1-like (ASCH) protein
MRKVELLIPDEITFSSGMSYEIVVNDVWWVALANGIKNVEGKKLSPTWSHLRTGDLLVFVAKNSRERFSARIVDIRYYGGPDPLRTYLEHEGLRRTLPGIETLEQGKQVHLGFSSESEFSRYGVQAIEIVRV